MKSTLVIKHSEIDDRILQEITRLYPFVDVEIISTEVDDNGMPITNGYTSKSRFTSSTMKNGFITALRTFYNHHDVRLEIKDIYGIETRLPRSKFDVERAKKLVDYEKSSLEPYLEELFEWLQDANWPVCPYVSSFLVSMGLLVVPQVREILKGTDDIWKMWVLSFVVNREDLIIANALRDEIERIAKYPTQGEILEDTQEISETILKKLN